MSTNPVPSQNSNALSILAIIFGGISVLILPILFGPIGIVLGIIAKTRKERLSTVGLIISIVGPVIGAILGVLVFAATV
mgnify:CR=1 FL=1|jgi:hypothetical protein